MRVEDNLNPQAALTHSTDASSNALVRKMQSGDEAEAADAFEKLFATMLVKELRRSLPEGFFSGAGSDVYGAWFDEHLGESLASRDALGLAGLVKTALGQEQQAPETAEPNTTDEEARP